MDETRLTKQIFNILRKNNGKNPWHQERSNEMRTYKIIPEIICNREKFRSLTKKKPRVSGGNQQTQKNSSKKEGKKIQEK